MSVVIAGGGIGGLAVALGMLDSGIVSGSNLVIVDSTPTGNRIHTYTDPNGIVCELGAGRFNPYLHPALHALIERFNIHTSPYRYAVQHRAGFDDLHKFADLDFSEMKLDNSFYSGLVQCLGMGDADRFCSLTGYEALRDHRLPAAAGIEIVDTHPEVFRAHSFQHDWRRATSGFEQLTSEVRRYLIGAGVTILEPAKLVAVFAGRGHLELELLTHRGSRRHAAADRLVLAMPPADMLPIHLPLHPDAFDWLGYVVNVPLFKGFFIYDTCWWNDRSLDDACVIANNQLQKIYFDARRRTVFFYCDSQNSDYWNTLRGRGESIFLETVFNGIEEAVGYRLRGLREPRETVFQYWPAGVSYLQQGAPIDLDVCTFVAENIVLSSDTFSKTPGWIEGALTSAQAAVSTTGDDLASK